MVRGQRHVVTEFQCRYLNQGGLSPATRKVDESSKGTEDSLNIADYPQENRAGNKHCDRKEV